MIIHPHAKDVTPRSKDKKVMVMFPAKNTLS